MKRNSTPKIVVAHLDRGSDSVRMHFMGVHRGAWQEYTSNTKWKLAHFWRPRWDRRGP